MSAPPLEGRVSRLEGAYEQVADRLNSIDRTLSEFRIEVSSEFRNLRNEIGGNASELRTEFRELRTEFREFRTEVSSESASSAAR